MEMPKLDAEGFPIAPASSGGTKLDAEGFPISSSAPVTKVTQPKPAPIPADFAAFKTANTPKVLTPAEKQAQNNAALLESQGVQAETPSVEGPLPAAPSAPSGPTLMQRLKAVPGRLKNFALEKQAEELAATKAQQEKLGTAGLLAYRTPAFSGLSPEILAETTKSIVGKGQKLWEAFKPNRAKENALWAERDMKDLLKEVGDKPPTPEQYQRFKDRAAFAKQMWALSETERGKRQEAVQGFAKRMDEATLPGTQAAKLVSGLAPLAVQAALAPGTIPIEMAANTVAEGQLRNPTYEQTTGQQFKEGVAGYGMGRFMMAGIPGVPVSRALQNLGVNPTVANLTGMVPTSAANVLGNYQLSRNLTTPHGEAPPEPTAGDFISDYMTQLGLGARHLNQPLVNRLPAGTPRPGEPSQAVGMGLEPIEGPMAPGGLNTPAPATAPMPAETGPVFGPAQLPQDTPGSLQTLFPRIPANLRDQLGVQNGESNTPSPTVAPETAGPVRPVAESVPASGGASAMGEPSGQSGTGEPTSPSALGQAIRPPRQEFFVPPGGWTHSYLSGVVQLDPRVIGSTPPPAKTFPNAERNIKLSDGTEVTLQLKQTDQMYGEGDGRRFIVQTLNPRDFIDPTTGRRSTGITRVSATVHGDTLHIDFGQNEAHPGTDAGNIVYAEAARMAKEAFPNLKTVSGMLVGDGGGTPIGSRRIVAYRLGYENSHVTRSSYSDNTFNGATDINSVINQRWSQSRRQEARAQDLTTNAQHGKVYSTNELTDSQLGRIGEQPKPAPKPIPEVPPEANTPQGPSAPDGPLHGPDPLAQRPQPSPLEGLPDAYGLAPVSVASRTPTPYKTLHEHEAEMAVTKQQRQADREALVSGPVEATADIAPEHHAEADRIIEARNIVTLAERRALEADRRIAALKAEGKEIPEVLAKQAKSRLAPDDPLRQLAASEPVHPDAQRALQVAQEQQQALAAEYAASTPEGEGDITHASRIALKEAPVEPTLGARVREFFGGAPTQPVQGGAPGTGKRPKQKNEYSKSRLYETVDGPTGPVVIYRGEKGETSYDIVGRSGKIQESDITGRRESTKDEITHATSQVEVEVPGEIDPDTGKEGPSHTEVELDPSIAINFSRNAVAGAAKARESARDAIRGRAALENVKANPALFRQTEAAPGSEWRDVASLPITEQAKNRLSPGGKSASVRSDAAQTLIEYFGQPTAKEASFLTGLNSATRKWTERGLLTNVFAHFPNQFAHGLGALSGEGLNPQQATNALAHAYREGQNPNSEYVNRAKAAGVKQMSEGRQFGENDNMTAHEVATAKLEAALGHEPGSMGKTEGNSLKRAFKALNQKTVWQIDDAIRNTLFYQKIAAGMTPAEAAKYANENYVGYHTDTNLFELSPNASPRRGDQVVKKGLNEIYRNLVTGKGETGKGFAGAGASLARTLVSPLFHTFRTNSATLLAHELKGAAAGLPSGNLAGLGKLANVAGVGTAVGGVVGQTLSDAFLTEDEKKQGKEYQMRMGGPFHWYDTAEKALEGRATPMQTAAAIATPNPLFKHLIGKGVFGVDVQSGRRAPAASLAELGDTVLSSVLPTGDIARNALQGQGNAKDVAASFLMGKNAPNAAAQIMMAHPDKLAAGTPDYEASKANFRLISQLRDLTPGSQAYSDVIQQAVKEQLLTKQQIANAAKRSGQSELEHMRALAKIATPEAAIRAGDDYAERSPQITLALYGEAMKKMASEAKKFQDAPTQDLQTLGRSAKLRAKIQEVQNKILTLRQ